MKSRQMLLKIITIFFLFQLVGGLLAAAAPFQIHLGGVDADFGRRLSGDRVGQHKVPPLSPIEMEITVSVSSTVDNAVIVDYFPKDWEVIDANGGSVSAHDEQYNKISWSIGTLNGSVTRSYLLTSPQLTTPPTTYYFRTELISTGGSVLSDDWTVIVADPTASDTVDADFAQGTHENTENVNNTVRLISGYTQGRFTSRIFDLENVSALENLIWTATAPTYFFQKYDNVGSEPTTLADGSTRKGTISGGSIADTRADDGVYENIAEFNVGPANSYTPTSFTVVDNTRHVSGTIANTASDDDVYLTLRSFISAENTSSRSRAFIAYRSATGTYGLQSPKVRSWDGYAWGAEVELPTAGSEIRAIRVAINPVSKLSYENIVVTLSADLYLDVYVWNGSTWVENHNINSSPVRATYPDRHMRPFDIAYEMKSGRAMLVYDIN
ncbi:MAG: hypothetical protein H5T49_06520, partial [Hadesarchaea archaeon]|nr:hypothetical protein [Hadesarchaea archaeon]